LGPGFLPLANLADRGPGFLKDEKLAEVILLSITYPFRGWLPALIMGILIIKTAIQAAMQVVAAMGADILAPNDLPSFYDFPAGIAKNHDALYTQLR